MIALNSCTVEKDAKDALARHIMEYARNRLSNLIWPPLGQKLMIVKSETFNGGREISLENRSHDTTII